MDNKIPVIIKLSGKNLSTPDLLEQFFKNLDKKAVIVHGGGVIVDDLLKKLAIVTPKIDGIRVSPKEAMPYITGMLSGFCNKNLQALALSCGKKALGLCATDGDAVVLKPMDAKFGQVASAAANDSKFLQMLLNEGFVPLISSIGIKDGTLYNINADDVALALAKLFKAPLILVSDVSGVLDDKGHLIPQIDEALGEELIARGVVTEGMVVKVRSALAASKETLNKVILTSLKDLSSALASDFAELNGTVFTVYR